jgi:D-3-phosphoglycerate dehydrogenase
MRVLITPPALCGLRGAYIDLLRKGGLQITSPPAPWDHQLSESELLDVLPGVTATIAASEPYTDRVMERHPQLKVIARVGVGYDSVDVEAATRCGIVVAISPGVNHDTVAEHAFALLLALAKHITQDDRNLRSGRWVRNLTMPVRGQTLGIVGLGRIGKAMALRGLAFGMRVVACEVTPDGAFAQRHGIRLLPLPELLAESDIISLHAPMLASTRHLINRETLGLMKPTALLINTARGGLVDEEALADALRSGRIAGAGLDVFREEPPPPNHPFFALENMVLTPHLGGTDTRSLFDMAELAARAIVELSQGRWPAELIVNPQVREKFRWS